MFDSSTSGATLLSGSDIGSAPPDAASFANTPRPSTAAWSGVP